MLKGWLIRHRPSFPSDELTFIASFAAKQGFSNIEASELERINMKADLKQPFGGDVVAEWSKVP